MDTTSDTTKNKGLAASTTNPETTPTKKPKFTDNSTNNQRAKLLDYLKEHGSITTAQARELLDVMSPAPRILELRRFGYLINTVSDHWISDHGINHKGVARYVLTQIKPIESEV
jgi:predicted HTH transcriptional regulator